MTDMTETSKEKIFDREVLKARIPGWGADLLLIDRPGIPKEKTPPQGTGAHWAQPDQQTTYVKIHKTIERADYTPVFGTTCPPRGLSGKMRDFAYKLGEGKTLRWVTLLMADRVDMVETIINDLRTGQAGNPIQEMGLPVEFREGGRFHFLTTRKTATLALGVVSAGALGLMTVQILKNRKEKGRQALAVDELSEVA